MVCDVSNYIRKMWGCGSIIRFSVSIGLQVRFQLDHIFVIYSDYFKAQVLVGRDSGSVIRFDVQTDGVNGSQQPFAQPGGNGRPNALAAMVRMGGDVPDSNGFVFRRIGVHARDAGQLVVLADAGI